MFDLPALSRRDHLGGEAADVAIHLGDLGIHVDGDVPGSPDPLDGLGEKRLDVAVIEGMVDLPGGPAQLVAFFHQVDREALVGQRQRRGHAGNAAADHERAVAHRDGLFLERHEPRRAPHRHPHEVNRLGGRLLRVCRVHP